MAAPFPEIVIPFGILLCLMLTNLQVLSRALRAIRTGRSEVARWWCWCAVMWFVFNLVLAGFFLYYAQVESGGRPPDDSHISAVRIVGWGCGIEAVIMFVWLAAELVRAKRNQGASPPPEEEDT